MNTPVQMPPLSFNDPKLPMMNEFLSTSIRENTNELLKALSRFDYMEFNRVPAAGGWSAGAIAEHLLLVELQIAKVLQGNSVPSTRDAQDKIETIKERITDRSQRIEAPRSLVPSDMPKDPTTLSDKILAERRDLIQIMSQRNLFHEYPGKPHRLYGVLSGIEWINFLIYHCRRHIQQLNDLHFLK